MPGRVSEGEAGRKRKRDAPNGSNSKGGARKAPKIASSDSVQSRILLLEEQILESRENYNNIVELQELANNADKKPKTATLAAVALCRVFCRLIADEKLVKRKDASNADAEIVKWLKSRVEDYSNTLARWIGSPDAVKENTALTLLMRVVKEETSEGNDKTEQAWRNNTSTFFTVIKALLSENDAESARQEFVDKYLEEHDDVRFFTFVAVKKYLKDESSRRDELVSNALDLLSRIEGVPESEDQLEDWYGETPKRVKHPLLSLNTHRKVGREAWLAVFRSTLAVEQRKAILDIITSHVLPWFANYEEFLADFLTDSFNDGGSTSLLALNGIFHLMTKHNLDYPEFYPKLYSLLDEDVMHSKYRNRFFRLLDTFMNSTHLPAAMVASFIKRLARLSLQAPPGAIVWVLPFVYNILKQHPPCTFMLHRPYHPHHEIYASNPNYEEQGMDDPFDMHQPDPMLTGAIDSSLWELDMLRSHYHPNVGALAKIIGEQFTKREYQMDDFLDHSYASLIDAELGKDMKKPPVVEWNIPKQIVTTDDGGLNRIGLLLQSLMDVS